MLKKDRLTLELEEKAKKNEENQKKFLASFNVVDKKPNWVTKFKNQIKKIFS
jgi:hypothetical protein